ncbi:MAG: hypothetical protein ACRBCS_05880 [Cellvibrionaceae bacterium]
MPDYRWRCGNCAEINSKESVFCEQCKIPCDANALETELVINEITYGPKKPSIPLLSIGLWGEELTASSYKLAPCPNCNLKMYSCGLTCPHCNYKLSVVEREELNNFIPRVWHQGALYAVIVSLILFLVFMYLAKYF